MSTDISYGGYRKNSVSFPITTHEFFAVIYQIVPRLSFRSYNAQNRRISKRINRPLLLSTLCLTLNMAIAVNGQEQEQDAEQESFELQVEEMIVTGTFITNASSTSHSPLDVYDREALDSIGATDIQEFIANMTANSGSLGNSASNWVGGDSSEGNASVNLRNLGNGATLVLLDGKRLLRDNFDSSGSGFVNIRTLVPNIALERVEVLKDGSSALYGSDAVAGVVNFITPKGFVGWENQLEISTDYESGEQQDILLSTMYGTASDRGELLIAASYLDRSGLQFADRYERYGRSGLSSFGQPGRFVPHNEGGLGKPVISNYWHPNGGPDPSTFTGSLPDLDCERAAANDGPMGTLGLHPQFSHVCVYDYSSFFHMVRPTENSKFHLSFDLHATATTTLTGSFSYADHESWRGNSLYPDVSYRLIPPSHLGLQLDAARRGFEPVEYQAMQRLMGGSTESTLNERPLDTNSITRSQRSRLQLGSNSELTIANREWTISTSLIRSKHLGEQFLPVDVISDRMDLAYQGLGGVGCNPVFGTPGSGNLGTGNCYYYNSFQTSVFDPVTGEPWNTSDLSPWPADPSLTVAEAARKYQNPASLLEWLHGIQHRDSTMDQTVIDLMATGDVMPIPHGTLDVAMGIQYRKGTADYAFDNHSNRFNLSFLTGNSNWASEASSWALYAETHTPLYPGVELRAAGRYERFSVGGSSTFDPKFSLLITTLPTVSIRGSWGTSFKIASLLQSGGSLSIFENTQDPFSNAPALAYRSSLGEGNPNLEPETADAYNLGVTWEPDRLPGLVLDFDYYRYEYENLISRERHQSLVDMDNALRCPSGINHEPTNGPLCGVVDHDGDGVVTVFTVGEGIPDKVIRREDGYLVITRATYFNAPSLTAAGFDISVDYSWDTDNLGSFQIGTEVSFATDYTITLEDGTVIDGLGQRNISNSIGRPMPEYRIRNSMQWLRDRHALSLSTYTIASYEDESAQSAFLGAYLGTWETIDSMSVVNAQYRVDLPELFGAEMTLGIKNLLNEDPPWVNVDGAYDYYTHDPVGRVYYMRLRLNSL